MAPSLVTVLPPSSVKCPPTNSVVPLIASAFTGPPRTEGKPGRHAPVVASTAVRYVCGWPATVANAPPRYTVSPDFSIERTHVP